MENRSMTRAEVLALADGSVFTGRQAKARGLVDSLGGEEQVRAWLETKGVDRDLEILEADSASQEPLGLFGRMAAAMLGLAGLDDAAERLFGKAGLDAVFLDGLVSVWQGSNRNPNGGSGQIDGTLSR
jgi:protease-4